MNDLPNLNQGAYKSWESTVKGLAQNNRVEVRVVPVYSRNNNTVRPDEFEASYRVNNGQWVNTVFQNQAGG